jgi:hypothetical protein
MSRIAGLDAKVTSLQSETTAQKQAREAAEQKLRDYEEGKVNADEALRAQLQEKERELEQSRREAAVAKIASAYPETFGVFGEAVANMTPDPNPPAQVTVDVDVELGVLGAQHLDQAHQGVLRHIATGEVTQNREAVDHFSSVRSG